MLILPSAAYSPIRTSKLTPCYNLIRPDRLPIVADAILGGEVRYQELLRLSSGGGALPVNLSRVHSYRDVETQAFIMAHHVDDPNADHTFEMSLRSMWVYLTHWFDDVFDYFRPEHLASMQLQGDFLIFDTLEKLDPRFAGLWETAIRETSCIETWNRDLLELGMRRLILGGPMLSPRCQEQNAEFQSVHRMFVLEKLDGTESYGVQQLVQNIPDRHLAYTSKVVVEIWDSFSPPATFAMSLLMGLFYAPGLLKHDYRAESDLGEISESKEDSAIAYQPTLDAVADIITSLPKHEIRWIMKPVEMFVCSFRKVLIESGSDGLLSIYSGLLDHQRVKEALEKR